MALPAPSMGPLSEYLERIKTMRSYWGLDEELERKGEAEIWFLLSPRSSSSAAFPNPFRCRFLGHKLSLASGTTQQSDYWQSTVSHFASAYRVTFLRSHRR